MAAGIHFSAFYSQSDRLCRFSPNGRFLATCTKHQLIIWQLGSDAEINVFQTRKCKDTVEALEWSSDSLYVLCGMYKRALVQVFSIEDPAWKCLVDEGAAGLEAVCFAPDGRHILSTSSFQLRVTIWSLVGLPPAYIKFPKLSSGGLAFSRDGKYLAVLERKDCKDHISIFVCKTWQMIKHFPVETDDACGLAWSPDDRAICVWDSMLMYNLCIYSPDGRLLGQYSAYDDALGIKAVKWSPSSQFLAIGSYDEKARLINHVTWKKISDFSHPVSITSDSTVVYKETEIRVPVESSHESFPTTGGVHTTQSKFQIQSLPHTVPAVRPDPEKPSPKLGVGVVAFSPDSRFMATRNDNMPNTLWIWDIPRLRLAVMLEHINPCRTVAWHPIRNVVAIASAGDKVSFWSEGGSSIVRIPNEDAFSVLKLEWSPDGSYLLLMDKDRFCTVNTADVF